MAGREIASLKILPLQYVPSEKKVIFNHEINLAVELEDADTGPEIPTETRNVRRLRNRIVESLIENPEDLHWDFPVAAAPLDLSLATEYLIICYINHVDEYENIANWKTRKGIPAGIITWQEILDGYPGRDDPEKFKNCIKDYYLNRSTAWVLLTGSARRATPYIRGCYCKVGDTVDRGIPCDLYFADMDGAWDLDNDGRWGEIDDDTDLYPDVYVGRLTANSGVECTTVVKKVLTYEGYYPVPTDYQRDMLFMAEYLDLVTDAAITKNMIDDESVPPRFDPITKLYQSSGNLNYTNAMSALNSGMNLVNHDGHGNIGLISIGPNTLSTGDMKSLTNGPRFSILYTQACSPAAFDNPYSFVRGFLDQSRDGGGFFVGNSRYGWYWPEHPGYGTGDVFDREFFKSIFVRGHINLGIAHADAKIQMIPYSGSYNTERWTQLTCNLFGDPEMPIWVDTPKTLSVTHLDSIEAESQTFTVSVISEGAPLEGARVCLWKQDDIYAVDETPSGGSIDFSICPSDSGTMLVTVVKEGYLPYAGTNHVLAGASGLVSRGDGFEGLRLTVRPNPVTGPAEIHIAIARGPNRLGGMNPAAKIYDPSGRLIRSLRVESVSSSDSAAQWAARLMDVDSIPPGIYFLKVSCGRICAVRKLIILK
jgi:hypothetical protein